MSHHDEDRVMEVSVTEGVGDVTFAGAPPKHFTFASSGYSDGDTFHYTMEHEDPNINEVEIGWGQYIAALPGMKRLEVVRSSNNNLPVPFSAGNKHIYISPIASRLAYGPGYKIYLAERMF